MTTPPVVVGPPPRSTAQRAWSHVWRLLVAAFLASWALLFYFAAAATDPAAPVLQQGNVSTWLVVDVALLLVTVPLYVLRHRSPLLVTGLVVVLGSFSLFASGVVILTVVSLATRRRWSEIGSVAALWLGTSLVSEHVFAWWMVSEQMPRGYRAWGMAAQLVSIALVVVTGMFIGGRRALVASLREQAAIARREADARGDSARAAERNRIAREMHDVLAHRLSLVALHSGALEYRAGLDPDQVRSTAAVVRENAHEALGELREVLGLLRDTTHGEDLSRPQPTFAQVDELVDGTRAAGTPVTFQHDRVGDEDLARLPVSTSRHLYRVVQECLTNARKHAPGQPVHVRVHGAPGQRVELEVTNPVPTEVPRTTLPPSGWGLTGVAERLRLTGGELDAGRRPDGTFRVHAWLPWATPPEEPA